MSKKERNEIACPDCQESVSPLYERMYITGNRNGLVQAVCPNCGWSTSYHPNTHLCRVEWTQELKSLGIKGKWA